MITALAGLVLLLAVVVSSAVIVRRRLRYETWYFVHLYAYLAVALAFSHQLATGTAFVGRPLARTFWYRALRRHARRDRRLPDRAAGRPEPAPPAARRPGRRGGAGLRVDRDRGHRPRPARGADRAVLRLALPDPRPLVGVAPVLALRRPRGRPAADHRQGRRRLQRAPALAHARHARDRRGPVRGVHHRRAAAPARRADRGRRRDHADPRAARGHAGRAGRHHGRLPRPPAGGRDPARRAGRARRAARGGGPLRARRRRRALGRAAARRWSPTSPSATSTSAARRR